MTSNQREVVPAGDDAQFLEFLKTWNQGIAIRQGEGFVFVNQAFADICGYDTPQALLSPGSALSLVAEGDRDRVTRYYKGRIGGGRRSGLLRDAVPAQGRLSLVG